MKKNTLTLIIAFLSLSIACSNNPKQSNKSNEKSNKQSELFVSSHGIIPKESFRFHSVIDSSNDTLTLVSCADFIYFPFGELKNKSDLKKSLLKNLDVTDRIEKTKTGEIEFQLLTYWLGSYLMLSFDNDSESSMRSYILKGKINDSEVKFINGVKIKMSKEDFIDKFFDAFPKELMEKYQHIVFKSCVQGITHTYSFRNDKLESVHFTTDSYRKIADSLIEAIRAEYDLIVKSKESYKKRILYLPDTGYYDEEDEVYVGREEEKVITYYMDEKTNQIRLISFYETWFHHTQGGVTITEYYLKDRNPFFIYQQHEHRISPWDSIPATESRIYLMGAEKGDIQNYNCIRYLSKSVYAESSEVKEVLRKTENIEIDYDYDTRLRTSVKELMYIYHEPTYYDEGPVEEIDSWDVYSLF